MCLPLSICSLLDLLVVVGRSLTWIPPTYLCSHDELIKFGKQTKEKYLI